MSRLNCRSVLGVAFAALLVAAPQLAAQTGTISGRVTDAGSGNPVPSAQVFIADLDLGVLSQQNGTFTLQNVPAGTQTVTVQRLGFREASQTVAVSAGEAVVLNFAVAEAALQLDEVIVTGTPGGTQRRALGNSVTSLDVADVVEVAPPANMQELLSGRTPGLQFTRRTGNVGSGSPIRVRGIGSFQLATNPLIYIDGVRVNNSSTAGPAVGDGGGAGLGESRGTSNVLDDLNPDDIESIEIIKGPAAATLYGTEASAGVIQIITKQGAEGDAQISASVRQGFNYMPDPAGKLGDQYGCRVSPNPPNIPLPPCAEGDLFRYNMYEEANRYISGEVAGPDGSSYFDWPTSQLYQYGHVQSYNVDIRGGTPTVRYFVSANWDREEGIEWYNHDQTGRVRMNLNVVPSESWTADISLGYVDGDTRFGLPVLNQGGPWQDMRWSNGYCLIRVNPDACPRLGGFQEHLPDDVANVRTTRDYSRFTGGLTLNHVFGDWLSQRLVLGVDKGWDQNEVFYPVETERSVVYSESANGQVQVQQPVTTNLTLDYAATVDYDLTEAWNFQTSVGGQFYVKRFEELENIGRAFASPLASTVNQTSIAQASIDYEFIENRSLGLYVQEQVAWNQRLFVTGAVRFDDNSAFGADFEALIYPKVSAAWVLSEEEFFDIDLINSLRLRTAWGQAGRQPDVFAKTNVWGVIPGVGGSTALSPVSPGNPEIGPEVSTELEVGFDVALLDERISGEFTYYRQKNEDALLEQTLAPNLGFPGAVQRNVGRIDNWGWEALLSARIAEGDSWALDLALNADHTDNEVVDLGETPQTTTIREGWPFPVTTGRYRVLSAEFDANGNIANVMCDSGVGEPGAAQFLGGPLVPCEQIAGAQRLMFGRGFYTYKYGVAPTLSLFNNALQIFALAEGQYGRLGRDNVLEWGHIYNNTRHSQLENDPLWVASDRGNFTDDHTKEYFDGDFWRMREIGVRYVLPESLVQRSGADRASVAFSARNAIDLWIAQPEVWGGAVGDPELGTSESLTGAGNFREMPPTANISMTLRVSF
jgi:TonB-linked SusC/RagA family outer membrane protein